MTTTAIEDLPIPLDRDSFIGTLVSELARTLEEVVGIDESAGLLSIVGQTMGLQINAAYRHALKTDRLNSEQLIRVLVDLKSRIQGDFYVIEHTDERIVLGNRACPFAEKVVGRPTLCMMTSNVFGSIAAENEGYAKVTIEKSIARGDDGCRVVVWRQPSPAALKAPGREYFSAPGTDPSM